MRLTKTTFELDPSLLVQLKTTAAHAGKSVRELLTEGVQAVLEKYSRLSDKDTLAHRARQARARMRAGYFSGPPGLSQGGDALVYQAAEPPPSYGARPKRNARQK